MTCVQRTASADDIERFETYIIINTLAARLSRKLRVPPGHPTVVVVVVVRSGFGPSGLSAHNGIYNDLKGSSQLRACTMHVREYIVYYM